jgi:protocatechuate 3,4-dioxygenase beta subunit
MLLRSRAPSRRDLIRAGAVGATALVIGRITSAHADDVATPTPECHETEDNLLGPYWRRSAPVRSDLTERGMAGTRLRVTGQVFGLTSGACTPIANALLDVWQADYRGRKPAVYSADGNWRLRGRLYTRADGSYDLRTIIPGHYGDGKSTSG